ncbi:hypothetical protein [Trinickia fusca]|uniref:hypothetical protein n=1 Tax=Trinickia fusca TaxID=2419777 RepID=UPI0026D85EC7
MARSTAAKVLGRNRIEPLQARFRALNEWAGEEVVQFVPYLINADAGTEPPAARN